MVTFPRGSLVGVESGTDSHWKDIPVKTRRGREEVGLRGSGERGGGTYAVRVCVCVYVCSEGQRTPKEKWILELP